MVTVTVSEISLYRVSDTFPVSSHWTDELW